MEIAAIPINEPERLAALHEYKVLDTPCEQIFDTITQIAALICHVPISLIGFIDKDREYLKSTVGFPVKESPRDTSFCSHTILGTDIMEIKDAQKDDRFHDNPSVVGDPHIRFYAGVPLTTSQGLNVGSLCVIDQVPRELTPEQKNILHGLSKIVMTVLDLKKTVTKDVSEQNAISKKLQENNLQLEKWVKEQKQNNDTSIQFSRMNNMLQSSLTYEEAYEVISNFCQKIFPEAIGTLYLFSSNRDLLELALSWKNPLIKNNFFSPQECWALRTGQYYAIENPDIDIICSHFKNKTIKNVMTICLPLSAQSETIGLLCLENPVSKMSQTQISYAVRMAEQIALCLANIKLRQSLRQQSISDPLTGLYNRRYLSEVFNRELHKANRKQSKLGVILIDIDFFKKFNDQYGHEVGDLVLVKLAETLRSHIRKYDLACRFGGEEFLLLVQDIVEDELLERAEKLRQTVAKIKLESNGKIIGPITISAGIAIYPTHGETLDELIIAADKALYHSKESGRNQITLAH